MRKPQFDASRQNTELCNALWRSRHYFQLLSELTIIVHVDV